MFKVVKETASSEIRRELIETQHEYKDTQNDHKQAKIAVM